MPHEVWTGAVIAWLRLARWVAATLAFAVGLGSVAVALFHPWYRRFGLDVDLEDDQGLDSLLEGGAPEAADEDPDRWAG